jgi:hypothetical protein
VGTEAADVNILDAMHDPALFGPWFKGDSWTAWRAFLAALFGLPLPTEAEADAYFRHTGRTAYAPGTPAREAWLAVGRRGGKSRIAALVAVYLAAFRTYDDVLAPGEVGTLPVIAADRRQARVVLRYIEGFFDAVPMLRGMVTNRTKETLELSNRCTIEVHTASWRTIRGMTLIGAVGDEIAFWRSDDSANPDKEILNALRPGMATVPGALLLCISSPYARRGVLWEALKKHHGKDGDPVLAWQAPTQAMNPNVDPDVIADAYEEDEASASAEYGAEFRRDIETFIDLDLIKACVIPDRHDMPPAAGIRYRGFCDPAGGSGKDSFTLAIAHDETHDGKVITVVDAMREAKPPFSPAAAIEGFAQLLLEYRITKVTGDRWGGEFPREHFRNHFVNYDVCENVKSDLYRDLLPLLTSGQVELPDNPGLSRQLHGLERRTARGGRDSIDHAPRAHDDIANAVAGVAVIGRSGSEKGGYTVEPFIM